MKKTFKIEIGFYEKEKKNKKKHNIIRSNNNTVNTFYIEACLESNEYKVIVRSEIKNSITTEELSIPKSEIDNKIEKLIINIKNQSCNKNLLYSPNIDTRFAKKNFSSI